MSRDKYQEQIDRLCAIEDRNDRLNDTLGEWSGSVGLFQYATPDGMRRSDCGCLTMIPACGKRAWTAELTADILADDDLPKSREQLYLLAATGGSELRTALERFAFWQRRLDREIRTPAPATK